MRDNQKNNEAELQIKPFSPAEKDLPFLKNWCEKTLGTESELGLEDADIAAYRDFVGTFFEQIQPNITKDELNNPVNTLPYQMTALQFLAYKGCHLYLDRLHLAPSDISSFTNNMSPMQLAVARGNLLTTQVLLAKGADLNVKNNMGESLLFSALLLPVLHSTKMRDNKEAIFQLLLPNIKDALKEKSQSGDTLLHLLAIYGYDERLKKCIKEDPSLAFVDNNLGHYPIHSAILNGQREAVKVLISIDGIEKLTDAQGRNALHYAAMHGDSDMMAICLNSALPIDAVNIERQTPLILAAKAGRPMAVKALLDRGAAINLKDYTDRKALDYAVESNAKDIIKILEAK